MAGAATFPFFIKVGEYRPKLRIRVTNQDGTAFDQGSDPTILFKMTLPDGTTYTSGTLMATDDGYLEFDWEEEMGGAELTDTVGVYKARFTVNTEADGDSPGAAVSIPSRGYIPIHVVGAWE